MLEAAEKVNAVPVEINREAFLARTHLPLMAQNRLKLAQTFQSLLPGRSVHPFPLAPGRKSPVAKIGKHRREKLNALYSE